MSKNKFKLGELADITSSKRIFFSEYVPHGVPFYRSKEIIEKFNNQNVTTELFIGKERFDEIKKKYGVPQKEDILLTSVGTLGVPCLIENEDEFYFKDGNLTWFREIKKSTVLSQYLYYWLISKQGRQKLLESSIGSTQQALTIDGLKNIEIELPSINDQSIIVKILSDLDSKIKINHRMNKTLESIAQAIFKQWFVEHEDRTKCVAITDVVELDPKISVKKRKILPYVNMKELSTEGMTVGIDILKPFSGGARYQNGDTLLARITPCLENGKTAFVGFLTEEQSIGFGSTEFIVMRAKKGISPQFVYCLARDPEFRSFAIKSMVGSSGRQRVQRNMLESYEIFKPNSDTMNNFHKITFPIFSKVYENWKETSTLIKVRDFLLPKLMSGRMRVGLNG